MLLNGAWILAGAFLFAVTWFAWWLDGQAPVVSEFADDDSDLDLMDRPTG